MSLDRAETCEVAAAAAKPQLRPQGERSAEPVPSLPERARRFEEALRAGSAL